MATNSSVSLSVSLVSQHKLRVVWRPISLTMFTMFRTLLISHFPALAQSCMETHLPHKLGELPTWELAASIPRLSHVMCADTQLPTRRRRMCEWLTVCDNYYEQALEVSDWLVCNSAMTGVHVLWWCGFWLVGWSPGRGHSCAVLQIPKSWMSSSVGHTSMEAARSILIPSRCSE